MADNTSFSFTSKVLERTDFEVFRIRGEEAISRPFRFEIDLVTDEPELDLASVVGHEASLTIAQSGDSRTIDGVLASFEQKVALGADMYHYRAVLVPRLWLLSITHENRIFGTEEPVTVVDVIKEKLTYCAEVGIAASDFELRLTHTYPQRDQIVQYNESDLAFISRMMEHWGLFYFFEPGESGDKLVIADANVAFPNLQDGTFDYRPQSGLASADQTAVHALSCIRRAGPKKVQLKEYNYRLPHVALYAEQAADDGGFGSYVEYGAHFRNPEEGATVARVRAEELVSRQTRFEMKTDTPRLAPGLIAALEGHFRGDFNASYLVVSIVHEGESALAGAGAFGRSEAATEGGYRNTVTATRSDVAFHAERTTPRPRLSGAMHAHVDSSGSGERAQIDDQGRYKVTVPFVLDSKPAYKGSQFMRMAQPHGGPNVGFHFPLRKGAEVIYTCLDGDPDRPIVTGAVPNPQVPSMVTGTNHTKNRIVTASGIQMTFQDGPGTAGSGGSGGSGTTAAPATLAPQRHAERPADPPAILAPQRQMMTDDSADVPVAKPDVWASLSAPATSGDMPANYLRLGTEDTAVEQAIIEDEMFSAVNDEGEGNDADNPRNGGDYTGGFYFTSGNYTNTVFGNYSEVIQGDFNQTVFGPSTIRFVNISNSLIYESAGEVYKYDGNYCEGVPMSYLFTSEHTITFEGSMEETYSAAMEFSCKAEASIGIGIGLEFNIKAGGDISIEGPSLEASVNWEGEYKFGEEGAMSEKRTVAASELIQIGLRPAQGSACQVAMASVAAAGLTWAAAAEATSIAAIADAEKITSSEGQKDHFLNWAAYGIPTITAGIGATTLAAAYAGKAGCFAANADVATPMPTISLTPEGLTLQVGPDCYINMNVEGIQIVAPTVSAAAETDMTLLANMMEASAEIINSNGTWQHDGFKGVTGDVSIEGDVEVIGAVQVSASVTSATLQTGTTTAGDVTCGALDCANIDCANIDCLNVDSADIDCLNVDGANSDWLNVDAASVGAAAVESPMCVPC